MFIPSCFEEVEKEACGGSDCFSRDALERNFSADISLFF